MTRRQEARVERLAEKDAGEIILTGREVERTFPTKEQAEHYARRIRHHVDVLKRSADMRA